MDAVGRLKGRPGMSKQDVCECRAKPTAPGCRICAVLAEIEKRSNMRKVIQFIKESYAELKKVVWPNRDDVVSSVKVVLVSTIIVAAVLGLIDFLLLLGIRAIF